MTLYFHPGEGAGEGGVVEASGGEEAALQLAHWTPEATRTLAGAILDAGPSVQAGRVTLGDTVEDR